MATTTTRHAARATWTIAIAAVSATIVLLTTYGAQVMVAYAGIRLGISGYADFRLVVSCAQVLLLCIIALLLRAPLHRFFVGKVPLDGLRAVAWFTVGGVMLSLLVSFTLVMSNTRAASDLPFSMMLQGWKSEFGVSGVPGRMFVYVVLAPIIEELLFRGLIIGFLFRRSTPWIGLATSTLLFAAAHSSWLIAACAGLVYGLLYLRYQSLLLCVIAHACNNLFTAAIAPLSIAYLAEAGFLSAGEGNVLALQLLWMSVVIACLVLFFRALISGAPPGWFRMQPPLARAVSS